MNTEVEYLSIESQGTTAVPPWGAEAAGSARRDRVARKVVRSEIERMAVFECEDVL